MGKVANSLFRSLQGPVVGLITDGGRGFLRGLQGLGAALGGPVTFGLYVAGNLITDLSQKAPKSETSSQALKTERPPRFSGYGRYKAFGAYILYTTTTNGYAVDVWAFHDGQIDGVEDYYLGDKKVVRLSNGFVQKGEDGAYGNSDNIQIGANLGLPTETVHAPVMARLPAIWTADHRGDGVVTGYQISKPVKATNFQEMYPSGGPNNTPLALVIRAQLVFDWRDPAQTVNDPTTWRWSENWVLHLAHYQLVRNAKTWERHFLPTLAYWTVAADDADLPVPLRAGGTEPRYRSCVSHRHAGDGSEHKAVIAALLACGDGWMCPREDGALVLYSGRYYEPTVRVGPDQVVGYTVEDGVEDENAVNQIGVTYVSDKHDFNTVDTDPWTDEDDILARGAIRADDLANQVPSFSQARRLAKRKMIQAMADKRGTVTLLSSASSILSERFIYLTLAEGLDGDDEFVAVDAPVEITGITRNLQTGIIQATWILADPDIDLWVPATEEGYPAPVGDVVPREPLPQPMIISATAQFSAVGQTPEDDSGLETQPGQTATGARILIAANGSDRGDLTWYARWRVGTSGSWNEREYADADPGPGVSFLTEFVPLAANINVEVTYSVGDGRTAPWSDPKVVDTRQQ